MVVLQKRGEAELPEEPTTVRFVSGHWTVYFLASVLIVGCGSNPEPGASTGSLQLNLELAGGVQIEEVSYAITGNHLVTPINGTIDSSAPGATASVEVFGILLGDGYLVEMMATSVDGATTCGGSTMFDIDVGEATSVMVMLKCKPPERYGAVRADGSLNVCAELNEAIVSPLETSVGADIDVSAQAVDAEGDSISYAWVSTGGSFADPTAPVTTYSCEEPGTQEIRIEVSDHDADCADHWTVEVNCIDEGPGGAGGAGGGAGGSAGTAGLPSFRLLYLADQETDQRFELFTSDYDGSDNTKISHERSVGRILTYAWAPNGSRVGYTVDDDTDDAPGCAGCLNEAFTVEPDGSDVRKVNGSLVDGGRVLFFFWSPDGSRVAYSARQDSSSTAELYTSNADGSDNRKVSHTLRSEENAGSPRWSPDGTKIAYIVSEGTRRRELHVVAPDGSNHKAIVASLPPNGTINSYAWSPDSARIAYAADQETDNLYELYSSAADGSDNRKMNHMLASGPSGLGSRTYAWSPDGTRIAYIGGDLYTTAANGADNQRVNEPTVTGGTAATLVWSPDSRRIAYRVDRVFEADPPFIITQIYTSRPDGTERHRINGALVPAVPDETDGGSVRSYRWSPNGSRIAYIADQDTDEVFELYTSLWDGSDNQKVNEAIDPGGDFVSTYRWSPDGMRIAYRLYRDTILELYSALPDGSDTHRVNGPLTADGDVAGFEWSPVPHHW